MDDNLSIKSSDSVTTSGEYEIVPEELESQATDATPLGTSPTLNIANNGNITDLEKNLTEVIYELDSNNKQTTSKLLSKIPTTTATSVPTIDTVTSKTTAPTTSTLSITNKTTPASQTKGKQNDINIKQSTIIMESAQNPIAVESITAEMAEAKINNKNVCEKKVGDEAKATKLDLPPVLPAAGANTPKYREELLTPPELNKVGQSVFYDCIDMSPTAEKQDDMKPERSDTEEEMSDIDQDCTIFSGVTYLGSAAINAPKSETEIQRKISELNAESNSIGLKVTISIPSCSEGYVVLHDANTNSVIIHYEISTILYYARGPISTPDEACFAFTWSNGESVEQSVFQCHVFRCHIPEAVNQVSSCFVKAFQPAAASLTTSMTSAIGDNSAMNTSIISNNSRNPIASAGYEFIVTLQIREKVNKSSSVVVPRDRHCFKLRCNTDKEVWIHVNQQSSNALPPLFIERCFGVLLSPGKLVRQADMQLLDMVSMAYIKSDHPSNPPQPANAPISPLLPYLIRAEWKASDKNFEQLNLESSKMYITVAVDLVIRGIQEPVRFVIETPVIIQSQNEMRLMDHFILSGSKRSMSQRFYLQLKDNGEGGWEVSSIDPSDEIVEPTSTTSNQLSILKNLGLSKMVRSTSSVSIEQDDSPGDYSSDGDEPLLSGTGEVSKDCSQDTLDEWGPVMKEWDGEKRPKNLANLVRIGIPEAWRGKIWQRLANVENKTDMIDMYRVLITKETKCETVILRDIHRTFPAHKDFREIGGQGQDALFKVSKAYAVYDSEVGYCQGLSFIAASLLLHMPEEEAFCALVALMYDYGLRDLYKDGFEDLYLRLYQLNRLIKDQLPKLHDHFEQTGVETHMFASQWFLTLFTARFPLDFVFHILDVFLLDGMPVLFQVAMALLASCENDLRQRDFEGILKYIRVMLPKKCRTAGQARKMMKKACEWKVKKLKHYKEEFVAKKEMAEKEEAAMKHYEFKFEAERKALKTEIVTLQKKLEQTIEKGKTDEERKASIIQEYKQAIQRQEQQITKLNDMLSDMMSTISKCSTCASINAITSLKDTQGAESKQRHETMSLGPLDPLQVALERIRELELELAQTKLAHVEAQCKNQDLNHQLNTTLTEIQANRNSWQPWLTKTISSIQEKVAATKRDTPTFQSYTNTTSSSPTPSFNSLERCHDSPNMRPKSMNSLPSTGRNSLDYVPKKEQTTDITNNSTGSIK